MQYVYLLQEREFIKTNENIYKFGNTKQSNLNRFKQYPKNSNLLFQMKVNDCIQIESKISKKFKIKYKQCLEIGKEYFEGDCNEMIHDIYEIIINEPYIIHNTDILPCHDDNNNCDRISNHNLTICNNSDLNINKIKIKFKKIIPQTHNINEYSPINLNQCKLADTTIMEQSHSVLPKEFIKDFSAILNVSYNPTQTIIDFDIVCKWFSVQKGNLKQLLIKHFNEFEDYIIENNKKHNSHRGMTHYQLILITLNCFKDLCVLSKSINSKNVHKYIIQTESIINK